MPRSYERSRSEERGPNLKAGDEWPKWLFLWKKPRADQRRPLAEARGSSRLARVDFDSIPPLSLCIVQSLVRVIDQALKVIGNLSIVGNTYTYGDRAGSHDVLPDPLRDMKYILQRDIKNNDHEFFAAISIDVDFIVITQAPLDALGHASERLISSLVAVFIVELLEMIDINDQEGGPLIRSFVHRRHKLDVPVELPPVINSRESILVDKAGEESPFLRIKFLENPFKVKRFYVVASQVGHASPL